jgi:hypothetical protein
MSDKRILLNDSQTNFSPKDRLNELINRWNELEFTAVTFGTDDKPEPNQPLFQEMRKLKAEINELVSMYRLQPVLLKEYNFGI